MHVTPPLLRSLLFCPPLVLLCPVSSKLKPSTKGQPAKADGTCEEHTHCTSVSGWR